MFYTQIKMSFWYDLFNEMFVWNNGELRIKKTIFKKYPKQQSLYNKSVTTTTKPVLFYIYNAYQAFKNILLFNNDVLPFLVILNPINSINYSQTAADEICQNSPFKCDKYSLKINWNNSWIL